MAGRSTAHPGLSKPPATAHAPGFPATRAGEVSFAFGRVISWLGRTARRPDKSEIRISNWRPRVTAVLREPDTQIQNGRAL